MLEKLDDIANVETITMDMCRAYLEAVLEINRRERLSIRVIVGRYHLVQSLNNKMKKTLGCLRESLISKLIEDAELPEEYYPAAELAHLDMVSELDEDLEFNQDDFSYIEMMDLTGRKAYQQLSILNML